MNNRKGYIVISPAKDTSSSLRHWGIGNPFRESAVKRDGKGQFSNVASKAGNVLADLFDASTITSSWDSATGVNNFTFNNRHGTREFAVTSTVSGGKPNRGLFSTKESTTTYDTDSKGRWVAERETHDGKQVIKTRFVLTKKTKEFNKPGSTYVSSRDLDHMEKESWKTMKISVPKTKQ